MFFLSPVKLMFVLAVALIVLGPDKLPAAGRKVGGLWSDLRRMRQRLEQEVRGSFPDLPPTHELQRMARSPLSYLDQLTKTDDVAAPEYAAPIKFTIPTAAPPGPVTVVEPGRSPLVLDDAQLN
jgi:Sec-independent protein translocase protein TatA